MTMDTIQLTKTIRELRQMTVGELREQYLEVFGEENRSRNRDYLIRRIAWRIQANSEGGITARARLRAEELANEADLRVRFSTAKPERGVIEHSMSAPLRPKRDPRLPPPGTIITREFQGQDICVDVGVRTFRWEGREFRTLSAIAKEVTGTAWNGFLFFKLGGSQR